MSTLIEASSEWTSKGTGRRVVVEYVWMRRVSFRDAETKQQQPQLTTEAFRAMYAPVEAKR